MNNCRRDYTDNRKVTGSTPVRGNSIGTGTRQVHDSECNMLLSADEGPSLEMVDFAFYIGMQTNFFIFRFVSQYSSSERTRHFSNLL